MTARGGWTAKVTAGLIVAGALIFWPSLNDPFHFDDVLITGDSNVTNPARWAHFLNPFHLRQLTFFTFYLNHLAGGLNPAGYHAVNVILHLANAVLFFRLLQRFVDSWVATASAALFLLHPIQTEAAVYVYQRSTLLACFFSLLGLLALTERRRAWAALAFFLAFESKEASLAVLLVVALFIQRDWWDIRAHRPIRPKPERIPPARAGTGRMIAAFGLVVLAIALGAAALVLAKDKTVGFGTGINPFRYLLTESRVIYTYLRLLVFPYAQSLEYDFQNAGGFLTITGIALMLAAGWRFRIFSVLAFFILLAPTSSIIPSADAAFEHRLYLPMLAFSLLAVQWISRLPHRTWIATIILAVLAMLTVRREMTWSSEVTLWEDTARNAPGKARVWFNLGGAYVDKSPEKARSAFVRALELQPRYPEALYNLGLIEQEHHNWSGALDYYTQSLSQNPEYWPASNNMANTYVSLGEPVKALEYFERTLRLNPDYWPAQYNIAIVEFRRERYQQAAARLRTVLDWRPDFADARQLLTETLLRINAPREPEQQLKAPARESPTAAPPLK